MVRGEAVKQAGGHRLAIRPSGAGTLRRTISYSNDLQTRSRSSDDVGVWKLFTASIAAQYRRFGGCRVLIIPTVGRYWPAVSELYSEGAHSTLERHAPTHFPSSRILSTRSKPTGLAGRAWSTRRFPRGRLPVVAARSPSTHSVEPLSRSRSVRRLARVTSSWFRRPREATSGRTRRDRKRYSRSCRW